ncbi:MAG: hypothetical protein K0U15_04425 [Proteobacteria bacterium]|nr:hypothetical protein [Pseudomonadota bacterium]
MTHKAFKDLSPPGNSIDILTGSGVDGISNMDPCHYPLTDANELVNVYIVLNEKENEIDVLEEDDDDDDDDDILLFKR